MPGIGDTLEVAVFAPLRRSFDYLPPRGAPASRLEPGTRVKVPFGRATRIGIVMGPGKSAGPPSYELKHVIEVIDERPVLNTEQLRLARWAADYYHHPVGDVLATMLPAVLRRGGGGPPLARAPNRWCLTAAGRAAAQAPPARAARRTQVLACLAGNVASAAELEGLGFDWRRVLRDLEARGWVEAAPAPAPALVAGPVAPGLNPGQRAAVDQVLAARGRYQAILLQGVTGSGKTEVYMQAIEAIIGDGRQALVLVPEIALTEQIVGRFERRFPGAVGVLHSSMNDQHRARTWLACGQSRIPIVLGTRSAVWVPLANPGIIIVDEEHDPSYKQQEGLRFSARDIAVYRARAAGVPVVLGSATPSLESYHNAVQGKYQRARLDVRAGGAQTPRLRCIDVRGLPLAGGLSPPLLDALGRCLAGGEQAILFLNRRGYAPCVICHHCGQVAQCDRCDARLVMHKHSQGLVCHHCGATRSLARGFDCCAAPDIVPLGIGTERIEEILTERFPGHRIARVDRDAIRGKRALHQTLEAIEQRCVDLVIGTQMLAKGHDFKGVTLVGIVDADSRLYSLDFRSEERLAQLLVQVAGRAGRSTGPGAVLIQTHHPEHPLLLTLLRQGYEEFILRALDERRAARLPPYTSMAVMHAEAGVQAAPQRFLRQVRASVEKRTAVEVEISGPLAATMEKKAGKYRALLVLTASSKAILARCLRHLCSTVEQLPGATTVRWAIDVDPQDAI